MSIMPVAIFDLDGNFIGYSLKDSGVLKLQTTNIYSEEEWPNLQERLGALNQEIDLRHYWPNPKDPAVLALLANETFLPIEYVEMEMIDDERSYYVWVQEPEYDHQTREPTGRFIDGSELDRTASVIRYKIGKVPKRPSDELFRMKKACEMVARQRAGLIESANA